MVQSFSEVLTVMVEPIAGGNGSENPLGRGTDHPDPNLLWLDREIEKTTSIPPGKPDWSEVCSRSVECLGKGKDWSVACYAVRGLYRQFGFPALAASLQALAQLARQEWETMSPALPKSKRRRSNTLLWLIEGLARDVKGASYGSDDRELLEQAKAASKELNDAVEERIDRTLFPSERLLREALAEALGKLGPAQVTQPPEPPPGPETPGTDVPEDRPVAPSPPTPAPPPVAAADNPDAVLSQARKGLFDAADALTGADPTEAKPYRIRRFAAWMNFDGLPDTDDEGRLALTGPEESEVARLREALQTDAAGVLSLAEDELHDHPLWLDLNHLVCAAMKRLGSEYDDAAAAVRHETAAFLARFPDLADLRFSNETRVADDETLAWIEAELRSAPGDGGTSAPATEAAGEAAPQDALSEAVALAAEFAARGDFRGGLEVLSTGMREAGGGRARFRWKLATAKHCAAKGNGTLALDLLEGLARQLTDRNLEAWEPELCVEVLLAVRELGRGKRGKDVQELRETIERRFPDLESRLANLDPLSALDEGKKTRKK